MRHALIIVVVIAFLGQPLQLAGEERTPERTHLLIGDLEMYKSPLLEISAIKSECVSKANGVEAKAGFPALLISWFANLAIKGYINHLNNKLKTYNATYTSGSQWRDSAEIFPPVESGETSTCFVLTRAPCAIPTDESKECALDSNKIQLELIGQILVTRTYTQVRPLGVRYVTTQAPAVDKAGMAISLTAETLWTEGAIGKSATPIAASVIVSESLLVAKDKHSVTGFKGESSMSNTKLYVGTSGSLIGWDKYPRFARIPVDEPNGSSVGISISVAEVGTPPKYIKALRKFFSDNEAQLSPLLAKAIGEKVDVDMEKK